MKGLGFRNSGIVQVNAILRTLKVTVFLGTVLFCKSSASAQRRTSLAGSPPNSMMTPQELFRHVSPSVFAVDILDLHDTLVGRGSAVAVASNRVVTNRHVLDAGFVYKVRQGGESWRASVIWVDADHDLAVLKADGLNAPSVPLRLLPAITVGERVYAIGTPEGLEQSLSEGIVSGLRDYEDGTVIQTSAPISPGSSGGGLFDIQGRLVGITTFGLVEGQNLNFALPSQWVQETEEKPSVLSPKKSSKDNQLAEEFKQALQRASTAEHNLQVMVQQRRLVHDLNYELPHRCRAALSVETDASVKCIVDEQSSDCSENWVIWQRASLHMLILRENIRAAEPTRDELEATFVNTARSAWSALADVYCKDRPGGQFTDLEGEVRACSKHN